MSRAERRKRTWKHIQRQKRLYEMYGEFIAKCPHYFHKKSSWGCRCMLCRNPRRIGGKKTFQENKIDIDSVTKLIEEHFANLSDEQLEINLREAGHNGLRGD